MPICFGGSKLSNRDTAASPPVLTSNSTLPLVHSPTETLTQTPTSTIPLSIQYPPISTILNALARANPDSDFASMLQPLVDVGVDFLDDVVLHSPTDLVVWTGLPEEMVNALHEHSVVEMTLWEGLRCFSNTTDQLAAREGGSGSKETKTNNTKDEDKENREDKFASHRA